MIKLRFTISVIICAVPFLVTVLMGLSSWFLYKMKLNKAADAWLHFWVQATVRWLFICFGGRVVIKGRENLPKDTSRICYIANHQSMMDIPAIFRLGVYPGVIGKVELKKVPLLNGLMNLMKCVYIDRNSLRESMKAIMEGTELLKGGHPMMIFPEGTRSKNYQIAEFKAGSFRMAKKAEAVICPVAIQNTRKIFEARASFWPQKVYVSVLPPIDTTKLTEEELKDIHTLVEDRIRDEYETLPLLTK